MAARACSALLVACAALLASGCGHHREAVPGPVTTITVPADEPPSPETWPSYPDFSSAHSCWTRPGNGVIRAAPSLEAKRRRGTAPAEIARRLLARLGDRRYIERITIGKPPAATLK